MRKFSRAILVAAGFAVVAPLAANAAPSAKLVQEINNAYGTSFKVPAQHATVAARTHAPAHDRAG